MKLENMWDDIILNSLVGISYDFETFVIGTGQIQIKGEFQITEDRYLQQTHLEKKVDEN